MGRVHSDSWSVVAKMAGGVAGSYTRAGGVPSLGLGCGFLSFFDSGYVAFCIKTVGALPVLCKGATLPLLMASPAPLSGASLGPHPSPLYPEETSAFLATACSSPALLALLSAPPSARMAMQEGMGL